MAAAQQFIGSKISLISKSEIRYEGILYSLDLQEATISLSKVRSFGTEGRPTERPVPPKDEIYEFIIFRGSDIKGIDVVEPPSSVNEQANAGPPSDPAIVEISHQYHPPANAAPGAPINSQQQQQHQQPMSSAYASFSGSSGASKPAGDKQQQPFSSTTAIISPLQQQHGNHQGGIDGVEPRRTDQDGARSASPKPLMQGVDNRQRQEGRGRGRGGQNYQNQQQRYNNYQGGGGGGFNRGGRPPHRGSFGSGGRGTGSFAQTTKRTTFAEEFDFEKSNEELLNALTNMKIKNPEEEPEEEKEEEVYYSKDNFFDNISCEALERSKGKSNRPDWRAERKLNAETFGVSENRRGGYYRGGRGFYRGGGGYRGGYGYNNRGGGYYRGGGGGGGGYYNRRGGSGGGGENRGGGGGSGRGRPQAQEEAAA